ncbi:hypothetical protein ACWDKQ_32890 [Saccharopolyspora sp. NPDC000995]
MINLQWASSIITEQFFGELVDYLLQSLRHATILGSRSVSRLT